MSIPGVWSVTRWDESVWTTVSAPTDPILSNYTQLVDAVVNLIRDDDVDFTQAALFVAQAHTEIMNDLMLDSRGGSPPIYMLARGTATTDDNSGLPVPEDFIKARAVSVNGRPSRYVSPEKVPTGSPGFAQATIQLDYYVRLAQLSASNPTNWLMELAPNVYIYRAALAYVPWAQREEKEPLWTRFYDRAINALKNANSPRPRGSFVSQKARPYGSAYTLVGDVLLFTGTYRNDNWYQY